MYLEELLLSSLPWKDDPEIVRNIVSWDFHFKTKYFFVMRMTFQSITTTKRFQIKLIIWENNTFVKQLKTMVAFFREKFKWKATDSMPMVYLFA